MFEQISFSLLENLEIVYIAFLLDAFEFSCHPRFSYHYEK